MSANIVRETSLSQSDGLQFFNRGKVRDIYQTKDYLLIVTTDRISAFDVVLSDAIPQKGAVLTTLSAFWFDKIKDITPTHLITADFNQIVSKIPSLSKHKEELEKRVMLVRKVKVFPVECIVRGYLAGSGWKEYTKQGTICGIELPPGLRECDRLPSPIFTPSTKASIGHDENISFDKMVRLLGSKDAEELKNRSIKIYQKAHQYALSKGIIIADTKFEWGRIPAPNGISATNSPSGVKVALKGEKESGEIVLCDEVLTPDSSRFWPADSYSPGRGQVSFDKQFVRDYLESTNWDKSPPAPELPEEIIRKTSEKYIEAQKRLTGNC
ncbi:MAG: phosphoribosylaminoimidazolesuccinocarboxamide synthase [Planctomycetota bacterium]|nr:phosphoribosylaminoimidazolesuccinocarboxamide synthase [Planctomycetota bacterium]MDI6786866.1 phosphoribosylaminoimidazolesuccinocarboxamide synthase [Planctomycetota bacterium]